MTCCEYTYDASIHYTEVQGQKIIYRFVFRTSIRNLKLILLSKNSHYRLDLGNSNLGGTVQMFPHQTFIVDNISQKVYLVCTWLYQNYFAIHFQFYHSWYAQIIDSGPSTKWNIESRRCKTVASVEVSCLGAWSNKPKISPISFSNFNSVHFFICSGEKHSPSIIPPKNRDFRF